MLLQVLYFLFANALVLAASVLATDRVCFVKTGIESELYRWTFQTFLSGRMMKHVNLKFGTGRCRRPFYHPCSTDNLTLRPGLFGDSSTSSGSAQCSWAGGIQSVADVAGKDRGRALQLY